MHPLQMAEPPWSHSLSSYLLCLTQIADSPLQSQPELVRIVSSLLPARFTGGSFAISSPARPVFYDGRGHALLRCSGRDWRGSSCGNYTVRQSSRQGGTGPEANQQGPEGSRRGAWPAEAAHQPRCPQMVSYTRPCVPASLATLHLHTLRLPTRPSTRPYHATPTDTSREAPAARHCHMRVHTKSPHVALHRLQPVVTCDDGSARRLTKWAEELGPVYTISMLGAPVLVITDPDLTRYEI